jgi:hypothetical protein
MLHQCRAGDKFAAIEGHAQINLRKHFRKQALERFNVAKAVVQNLRALFGCERPALHDAFLHRVLTLAAHGIEAVIR